MSRSCYSDDYGDEFPGQINLYRANVQRSIASRAGQARLRELRDALLSLPTKELEAELFAGGTQDAPRVCALGAWALAKAGGDVAIARDMVSNDADDHETYEALKSYGWPRLVVLEGVYVNDEGPWGSETTTARYTRVLSWVESQLALPPAADAVDPSADSTGKPTTRADA